jgi:transcriptional regulator with XRE-family HTH domain
MSPAPIVSPEDVRRVRRHLDETQAEFAKRFEVDPVTVARWETGQRRCAGLYAATIARLDPQRGGHTAPHPAPRPAAADEDTTLSALGHFVRAFFEGSTARAVSALLARETLSDKELEGLSRLIEQKKKQRKKVRR